MFVSADVLNGALPPILIIGSGPAGVTLSLELAKRNIPSLIVEGGAEDYSDASQDVYVGKVIGDEYYDLDVSRLRYFGGTSNHWAGMCRTLDPADFEDRPDLGVAGWPITHTDLEPYKAQAEDILDIGPIGQIEQISERLIETTFAKSEVNFAEKYREFLETSALSHILFEHSVTALFARDGRIESCEIRDTDNKTYRVSPAFTVVCCGGIENSRLLLWSNEVSQEPVVQGVASLGRYWTEHPEPFVGRAYLNRHISKIWNSSFDGYGNWLRRTVALVLNGDAAKEFGVLSARVLVEPSFYGTNATKDGVKRAMCAVGSYVGPIMKKLC